MTNGSLLKKIAKSRGYTITSLAKAIGLSRWGLLKKIDNRSEFKVSEICIIAQLLKLTRSEREAIFFNFEVAKMATSD